jgi:uncharacterized protein YggE
MKGLNLLCLLVFVAAAVSLACSQEVSDPETAVQSGANAPTATAATNLPTAANAPTATAATNLPTAAPVTATVKPMPTAISTEVPTPPAAPKVASPTGGENGALVVLGSRSAAAPSRLGSGNIGGLSLSPLPQTMAVEGSLTVSATGMVTVTPDEAYVVVIPERDYGPSGPQQLSVEDRQDILANLAAIGLNEEAVEFEHLGRYEPSTISVEVEIDEFASTGDAIVDAIEKVVRRSESFGVRFGLSEENCDRAVSLARREAVPGAEKAADDLADALELERGEVIGALEYSLQNVPFGIPGAGLNPCTGQNAVARYAALLPFDSEPEVEVSVGLQVSYRIR